MPELEGPGRMEDREEIARLHRLTEKLSRGVRDKELETYYEKQRQLQHLGKELGRLENRKTTYQIVFFCCIVGAALSIGIQYVGISIVAILAAIFVWFLGREILDEISAVSERVRTTGEALKSQRARLAQHRPFDEVKGEEGKR